MKKSIKYISLIIAAIFLITGTMLIAFADDDPGAGVGDPGGGAVDNSGGGAVDNSGGGAVDNSGGGAVDNSGGAVDNSGGSGSVDNGDSGYSGGYSDAGSGYDYDYSDSGQVYYDSDPIVYGDSGSNNAIIENEEAAGSVSSNTTLYNSSGMSAQEAAPNEWSDITLDEKKITTGSADFSSIKTNTETTDNGNWILYLGYILLGLSALGILYFIIATIAYRAANKKAERLERRHSGSSSYAAERPDDREYYEPANAYPRTSRFADEGSYSRRRSSRADTGEVYVPRRTRAK